MRKFFRVVVGVAAVQALSMLIGGPAYGQLIRPRAPVQNPPVANPPAINPPVVNPPIVNPPIQNPPVQNPPAVQPGAVLSGQAPDTTPREAARDTRDTVRDNARAARDDRRDQRRERRSDRDLGINWGRMAERGLVIANLASNGALYNAGLRADDQIVSINGHRLEASTDFDRYAYTDDPNAQVRIIVWRNGREETIEVNPSIFFAGNDVYTDDLRYFGVVFDERYPDRLVVRKVYPDSPAFAAGLHEGDEITQWHGEKVRSPRQFEDILHRVGPGTVDFDYSRDNKSMRGEAKFAERREANDRGRDEAREPEPRATEPRTNEPRTNEPPRANEPRVNEPQTPKAPDNPRVNPNPHEPGANPSAPRSPEPGAINPGSTRPMPERNPGNPAGGSPNNPSAPTPREGNPTPNR